MKRLHRIALSLCLSLLLCVTCSSLFSVKVYAAEVSPDANEEWFLLPFDKLHLNNSDTVGSFDINSGTYSSTISGSSSWPHWGTSNIGGTFPIFRNGHKYLFYYTFSFVSSNLVPDTGRMYFRQSFDSTSYSFYPTVIYNKASYVNSTTTVTGLSQYIFSSDFSLSTASGFLLNFPDGFSVNGRVTWAVYCLDVTENTEDEVNQIIAAIQDQTGQIKDKIDEVLTPEGENNLGEAVDQITDQVQENLGALGFAHDTVENFIGLFYEEPPAPIINAPPLKMKIKGVEYQFFNGYQYDFRSMEDNGLSVLVVAVRTANTLVLWWAFLQYCLKEFDQFFRR